MHTEPAIVIQASDNVGPTRLRVQTASSAKLPVVVREDRDGAAEYHVFTVSSLQAALTDHLSTDGLVAALGLADRTPIPPVSLREAMGAPLGTPVVENGRVLGVRATDAVELAELTEADVLAAGASSGAGKKPADKPADKKKAGPDMGGEGDAAQAEGKRGLWKRITRSAD